MVLPGTYDPSGRPIPAFWHSGTLALWHSGIWRRSRLSSIRAPDLARLFPLRYRRAFVRGHLVSLPGRPVRQLHAGHRGDHLHIFPRPRPRLMDRGAGVPGRWRGCPGPLRPAGARHRHHGGPRAALSRWAHLPDAAVRGDRRPGVEPAGLHRGAHRAHHLARRHLPGHVGGGASVSGGAQHRQLHRLLLRAEYPGRSGRLPGGGVHPVARGGPALVQLRAGAGQPHHRRGHGAALLAAAAPDRRLSIPGAWPQRPRPRPPRAEHRPRRGLGGGRSHRLFGHRGGGALGPRARPLLPRHHGGAGAGAGRVPARHRPRRSGSGTAAARGGRPHHPRCALPGHPPRLRADLLFDAAPAALVHLLHPGGRSPGLGRLPRVGRRCGRWGDAPGNTGHGRGPAGAHRCSVPAAGGRAARGRRPVRPEHPGRRAGQPGGDLRPHALDRRLGLPRHLPGRLPLRGAVGGGPQRRPALDPARPRCSRRPWRRSPPGSSPR